MNDLILRAKNGDSSAMNELVKENVGLIWSVVRRFSNRGYELEDLFQIGSMGFIKAVKNFDINMENKLSTYAVTMVIGEIKRFLRDDGMIKVSRNLKEISTRVRILQKEYEDKNQNLTIDEMSKILNIEKEDIVVALDATSIVDSLDRKLSDDTESKTIGDVTASPKDEYDELLKNLTVNSMINVLDDDEKRVIIYRYYRELTQTNIAKMLGTSQVQVSRIEKKAIEKMRCVMKQ